MKNKTHLLLATTDQTYCGKKITTTSIRLRTTEGHGTIDNLCKRCSYNRTWTKKNATPR